MSTPPGSPDPSGSQQPGPDRPDPVWGRPGPAGPEGPTAPYPSAAPGYGAPGYGAPGYGAPGYAAPGYGPGYPQPGYPPPTNGKATGSLITGITTLVLSCCPGAGLLGLVALVLGVKARGEIRASQGTQGGAGLALAGIITGGIALVLGLLVVVVIAVLVAQGEAAFQEYGGTELG